MQTITNWLTFSNISGLASIIGFLLTLYVLSSIRKIEKDFLFRVRLPNMLKKLKTHASKIAGCLQNFPETEHDAIEELSIAKVNINSLYHKSPGSIRNSLKNLEDMIDIFLSNTEEKVSPKTHLRRIYLQMNMVIQEIDNLQEDDKWRQRGG